jgi:quercetin dioxygenase-like cupin family protein
MDPSMELDEHTHDFDVRALVTSGEISITVDGTTQRYGLGDQFTMAAGRAHSEIVGPEGVTFVVGRRKP